MKVRGLFLAHDSIYRSASPATPDAKVRQQSQELAEADHVTFFFLRSIIIGQSYVQINPFIPSPRDSATVSQSFRPSVNILSRPAFAGGGVQKCFSPGPEPALDGPASGTVQKDGKHLRRWLRNMQ